ncbi:hypothetical protein [uncultured Wocania sp.]|uniref:hypothetical protein n=1 Tax=uncultured Wocania sp. TaxID=2834404 RepID=UPI0030F85F75
MITPLNLSGKEFSEALGITYNGDILKELRSLQLVSFFKIGKKYMYPTEDVKKVSNMLRNNEISIKTNNGYYITINKLRKTN